MPTVLVPLAEGCEELEAVTIIDLLRRADITVVTAGLQPGPVRASRGVVLVPDATLDEALQKGFDMIVLPGGLPGADHLNSDARIHDAIKKSVAAGKPVGAICAAPTVLARAGVLSGKKATAYPGFLEKLGLADVTLTGDPVTVDGKVVTGRGPGTAMDFALAVIEMVKDKATRDKVEKGLVRS